MKIMKTTKKDIRKNKDNLKNIDSPTNKKNLIRIKTSLKIVDKPKYQDGLKKGSQFTSQN